MAAFFYLCASVMRVPFNLVRINAHPTAVHVYMLACAV